MHAVSIQPWRKRGSILFYSVVMLTIAGIAVLGVSRLVGSHLRGVRSAEERLKAQYIAEAGINQVVDWFNRGYWTWARTQPQAAHLDPSIFHDWTGSEFTNETFQNYFYPDTTTGRFVNLARDSVITNSFDILSRHPDYIPEVKTPDGAILGTITGLRVYSPDVSADPEGTVCWVECTARTADGTEAWVQMQLTDNQLAYLEILAAIMSKISVDGGGQFNVHWGEVWAHTSIDIPNTKFNGLPKDNDPQDPWFMMRAEGIVRINGNDTDGTQQLGYLPNGVSIPGTAQNYYIPYLEETLHPDIQMAKYGNRENLLQHVTDLEWPIYEYDRMKTICEIYGYPIFRTTPRGLIVYDKDLEGNPVTPVQELPFEDVFGNVIEPGLIDRDQMPPLYFIDTVDGNPPNGNVGDGGNVATITEQGNGTFYHGLFFMAANLDMEGQGNPPSVWGEKPDSSTEVIKKCRVHGLLYTYGTFEHNGQGVVFGAVYAEKGFGSGGCPEVYYDYRLKNLLRNRIGSTVIPQVWRYGYKYTYAEGEEDPDPYYLQEELERSDWL